MLSHLEYLKYLPGLACLAGLCWLLFSGNKRLFSMRRQLPLLSLAVALLTVSALLSTFYFQTAPVHAMPKDTCPGQGCTGLSPVDPASACWLHHALIVNSMLVNDTTQASSPPAGTLRMWYSTDCQANWAQFVGGYDTTRLDQLQGSSSLDGWASGAYGDKLGNGGCAYNNGATTILALHTQADIEDPSHGNQIVKPNTGVSNQLQNNSPCTAVSPMVYSAPATAVTAQLTASVEGGGKNWTVNATLAQNQDDPTSSQSTNTGTPAPTGTPITNDTAAAAAATQVAADATSTVIAAPTTSVTPTPTSTATSTPSPGALCTTDANGTEALASGWTPEDIGNPSKGNGKATCQHDQSVLLGGSGFGYCCGNTTDQFFFLHRSWKGAGTFIVKINSYKLGNLGGIGIMARSSTTQANSNYVSLGFGQDYWMRFQVRDPASPNAAAQEQISNQPTYGEAVWLRIDRSNDNMFTTWVSIIHDAPQGPISWQKLGDDPNNSTSGRRIPTSQDNAVEVGIALTPGVDGGACSATISNVSLTQQ